MNIKNIELTDEHWTSGYIPISYSNILTKNQYDKSVTFFWNTKYELHAICRAYYINKKEIQIGDLWLHDDFRGKKFNNVKLSVYFMKKIISKIWRKYKDCEKISLIVHKDNYPAIKLYKKLNFVVIKSNVNSSAFKMKNGFKMVRKKNN